MKLFKILALTLLLFSNVKASDTTCIAEAIYFEARGESLEGQKAVAKVILNRMQLKKKSACWVINEKNQFSFKKNKKRKLLDSSAYQRALIVAKTTKPSNSFKMDSFATYKAFSKPATKIGNHYFMRQY